MITILHFFSGMRSKGLVFILFFFILGIAQSEENLKNSGDSSVLLEKGFDESFKKADRALIPCNDETFVRRVYLDIVGRLPRLNEIKDFQKGGEDKRAQLIDQLVESEEWADLVTMRFADMLRIKSEFPINLWPNAVQLWTRKIKEDLMVNKSYDCIVRAWLTTEGSNFRQAEVNFFRSTSQKNPEGLAKIVALNLLGMRYENLKSDQQKELAKFFSHVNYKSTDEWKEEIVYFDRSLPPFKVKTFDGKTHTIKPVEKSPSEFLADWLVSGEQNLLAEAFVNKVWHWILGKGLVQPADDMVLTFQGKSQVTLAKNQAALKILSEAFRASGYDIKRLFKMILNSAAYQASSEQGEPVGWHYPVRRLDAEVIYDILHETIGFSEKYSSVIPEPFTFLPANTKAIHIADGSISSSFLNALGRPSRDQGILSERKNDNSEAQHLFLMNSEKINSCIVRQAQKAMRKKMPKVQIEEMYLRLLSRKPTEEEEKKLLSYLESSRKNQRQKTWEDIFWVIINSKEFLYHH